MHNCQTEPPSPTPAFLRNRLTCQSWSFRLGGRLQVRHMSGGSGGAGGAYGPDVPSASLRLTGLSQERDYTPAEQQHLWPLPGAPLHQLAHTCGPTGLHIRTSLKSYHLTVWLPTHLNPGADRDPPLWDAHCLADPHLLGAIKNKAGSSDNRG